MTTYGVDEAEAIRRLELQDRAPEMADTVRQAVGDELLDVRLDQQGGGKLRLLTSEPERAEAALATHYDLTEVTVVRSEHTAVQLRQAEKEVSARLASVPEADVGIDFAKETIVAGYVGGDKNIESQVKALAGNSAGSGIAVRTEVGKPVATGQQKACSIWACDPPIRGGVRLHVRRDDGSWGSCTSAFLIRGSNGAAFLLTAGHCATHPGPKRTYMYHNGLPAVVEVNASGSFTDPNAPADSRFFDDTYPTIGWTDYALLPFQVTGSTNWHQYWFTNRSGHNLVRASCVTPSANACTSGSYAITGLVTRSNMILGTVVCATGTGRSDIYSENAGYTAGTRCGQILDKEMLSYTSSNPLYGKAIKVNICTRLGDSGGPLWSQSSGKAYGILSGGPSKTGACNLSDPDYGVYSPIDLILTKVSSKTGITMSLITTSGG